MIGLVLVLLGCLALAPWFASEPSALAALGVAGASRIASGVAHRWRTGLLIAGALSLAAGSILAPTPDGAHRWSMVGFGPIATGWAMQRGGDRPRRIATAAVVSAGILMAVPVAWMPGTPSWERIGAAGILTRLLALAAAVFLIASLRQAWMERIAEDERAQ